MKQQKNLKLACKYVSVYMLIYIFAFYIQKLAAFLDNSNKQLENIKKK